MNESFQASFRLPEVLKRLTSSFIHEFNPIITPLLLCLARPSSIKHIIGNAQKPDEPIES